MIVLLSGEIATGKTILTKTLHHDFGFSKISTGQYLINVAKQRQIPVSREVLQQLGDEQDQETNGAWITHLTNEQISTNSPEMNWVLDSVRRDFQVHAFREAFPESVVHIHLFSSGEILRKRFHARAKKDQRDASASYDEVKCNATEKHVEGLKAIADVCFNTGQIDTQQIASFVDFLVSVTSKGPRA